MHSGQVRLRNCGHQVVVEVQKGTQYCREINRQCKYKKRGCENQHRINCCKLQNNGTRRYYANILETFVTIDLGEVVQNHLTRQPRLIITLIVQCIVVVQARQHVDQTKSILTPTTVGIVRGLHAV